MVFKVRVLLEALAEGKRLPPKERQQLIELCKELANDPRPSYAKPIVEAGCDNCFRLRKGNFRVVYQIRDKELVIIIARVGDRKEVYKNLAATLKRRLKE